jgi:tRNA A-37 threonylcarbamoyl transferase component Bud32
MDYSDIEEWESSRLRETLSDFGLKSRRSKRDMVSAILKAKDASYVREKQLGEPGKDATTYRVNRKYALKQFKPRKSTKKITEEVELQRLAASKGVAPKIIDVDLDRRYILMDKLDHHLIDVHSAKVVSADHQIQLLNLYDSLDKIGVFHGDANPLNYMYKKRSGGRTKLYVIDFGMSKKITPNLVKKLGTNTPNRNIMTLGMIIKLKLMGFPPESYEILSTVIPTEQKLQLGL